MFGVDASFVAGFKSSKLKDNDRLYDRLFVTYDGLFVTLDVLSVTYDEFSDTYDGLSVTFYGFSITYDGLSVAYDGLSVTFDGFSGRLQKKFQVKRNGLYNITPVINRCDIARILGC